MLARDKPCPSFANTRYSTVTSLINKMAICAHAFFESMMIN
jgi:hypothetical protein